MTSTTTPPAPSRRPTALPAAEGQQEHRVARGAAALVGALLLLVGVPVALVLLIGDPLPTSAPSHDWLTADVTPEMVIDIVAVLVWVVWVHFVVCFLTEWRAVRRGRLPHRVMMGGGSQLLARQLVAGVLLLAGGASVAHGITGAFGGGADHVAAPATTQVVQVQRDAGTHHAADHGAEEGRSATGDARKFTVVRPPEGRHHDTLWGIAERYLGDPLRWKEIYQLNQGRLQPDGARLTDADLIKPGWQVLLPADATGPGVQAMPVSGGHHDAPQPVHRHEQRGEESAAGAVATPEATPATSVDGDRGVSSGIESILLGGGLILAGVARALTARRGAFAGADADTAALEAAAAWRRASLVDDALRSLAQQRRDTGQPMPEVLLAYVDDERLVLHLATPAGEPGHPWVTGNDGRSWTVTADDVRAPGRGAPAPYPSLVTVAASHGFDVLVDLEVAPGLVALAGDERVARDLVTAMAADLCTHAWSDELQVVMVGFGDHLVDLDNGRARRVDSLDDLLGELAVRSHAFDGVAARLGVTGLLQGRQRGAVAECAPTVVFLSGPPTSDQAQRLADLTASGRTPISVVCVGDSPSSRWRFVVDADGRFEALALGLNGRARRLDPEAQRALRTLIQRADATTAETVRTLETTPARALAAQSRQTVAAAPAIADAAVTVRLLGPVHVDAPGEVDAARRPLLTEVVVMTALHPDGLHPAVLRASIWPRGVDEDVVEARIAEARRWLGTTADGRDRLDVDEDGRLRLTPDVASDYAALAAAAESAGPDELDRIVGALAAGTGAVFTGDGDRYHWLAFGREARQCRMLVVSASLRAADLALAQRRTDTAVAILRQGLLLVPAAESLWRALLRLTHDTDPAGVAAVIDQMYSTLQGAGGRHEPETEALVSELAPGWERVRGQ